MLYSTLKVLYENLKVYSMAKEEKSLVKNETGQETPGKLILIKISTPEKEIVTMKTHMVLLPGPKGCFGVLEGHEKMIAKLVPGQVQCVNFEGEITKRFDIEEGIAHITGKECKILSQSPNKEKIPPQTMKN